MASPADQEGGERSGVAVVPNGASSARGNSNTSTGSKRASICW